MRVLLAVGCDNYLSAPKLTGAVKDAESIFSALVGNQEHQYDTTHSKLLLSPSAENFRKTLSDTLYNNPGITVFTLYFAGHAAVFDETLYIALKDATLDRIPATAIGFPEVLRTTTGARPRQANFILDACNAGGFPKTISEFASVKSPAAWWKRAFKEPSESLATTSSPPLLILR